MIITERNTKKNDYYLKGLPRKMIITKKEYQEKWLLLKRNTKKNDYY